MDFQCCLVIILIILKLLGVLTCPWWAVFTPLLLPWLAMFVMFIALLILSPFIKVVRK